MKSRRKLIQLVDGETWTNPDAGKSLSDFKRRWFVFGTMALVIGLIDGFGPSGSSDLSVARVRVLGLMFGLVLWPAVAAGVVAGTYRLFGKRLAPYKWMGLRPSWWW